MFIFLANHVPIVITAAALFLALFIHYFMPNKFWQPCFIVAIASTVVAYCLIILLPVTLPDGITSKAELAKSMTLFTLFSSFVLAIIVGYLLKILPAILDKM